MTLSDFINSNKQEILDTQEKYYKIGWPDSQKYSELEGTLAIENSLDVMVPERIIRKELGIEEIRLKDVFGQLLKRI